MNLFSTFLKTGIACATRTILALIFLALVGSITPARSQTWQTPAQIGGTNYINGHLSSTYFVSDTKGWAAGTGGVVVTNDGGASWTAQNLGSTQSFSGIYFVSDTKGWVVGTNGTILTTNNGGVTWTPQASGLTATLTSVYFVNATQGWVVGAS